MCNLILAVAVVLFSAPATQNAINSPRGCALRGMDAEATPRFLPTQDGTVVMADPPFLFKCVQAEELAGDQPVIGAPRRAP